MAQQTTQTPPLTAEQLKTLVRETVRETVREAVRETIRETVREILPELMAEIIAPRLDALAARLEDHTENLIFMLEQELPDPDEGLELSPEFEAKLREAQKSKKTYSLEEVK